MNIKDRLDPPRTATGFGLRHVTFGWWSLIAFLTLGIALEAMHGFKVRWYLDVSNETRRLMWTLAHAHGTLLSLVHIAFGLTLRVFGECDNARCWLASRSLIAASLLLPGGFLFAGVSIYDGDPGLGIVLVPLGAAALLIGTLAVAWRITPWRR